MSPPKQKKAKIEHSRNSDANSMQRQNGGSKQKQQHEQQPMKSGKKKHRGRDVGGKKNKQQQHKEKGQPAQKNAKKFGHSPPNQQQQEDGKRKHRRMDKQKQQGQHEEVESVQSRQEQGEMEPKQKQDFPAKLAELDQLIDQMLAQNNSPQKDQKQPEEAGAVPAAEHQNHFFKRATKLLAKLQWVPMLRGTNQPRPNLRLMRALCAMAARLKPKTYGKAPILGAKQGQVEAGKGKEVQQGEGADKSVLANVLWTLSSALYILGSASALSKHDNDPEEEENLEEQYKEEAKELRQMAKDLASLGDPAAFDASPLMDLLIGLCLRNKATTLLADFTIAHFVPILSAQNVQQIVEALSKSSEELANGGNQRDEEKVTDYERENADEEEEEDETMEEDSMDDEEELSDDGNEAGDERAPDPALVKNIRKALGDVGFAEGQQEVPDQEDNWELDDAKMFELDSALGKAFRKNSAKFQRIQKQSEQQTLDMFRGRLVHMLGIYIANAQPELALDAFLSTIQLVYRRNRTLTDHLFKLDSVLYRFRKNKKDIDTKNVRKMLDQLLCIANEEGQEKANEGTTVSTNTSGILHFNKMLELVAWAVNVLFPLCMDFNAPSLPQKLKGLLAAHFRKCITGKDKEGNECTGPSRKIVAHALRRLLHFYGQFFGNLLPLCMELAFDTNLAFENRSIAIDFVLPMFRADVLKNPELAQNVAEVFASNLTDILTPGKSEMGKQQKSGKRKREENKTAPTKDDASKMSGEERSRLQFTAKAIHAMCRFCDVPNVVNEQKDFLKNAVEQEGLAQNFGETIEKALGPVGMKFLSRQVALMKMPFPQFADNKGTRINPNNKETKKMLDKLCKKLGGPPKKMKLAEESDNEENEEDEDDEVVEESAEEMEEDESDEE